MRKMTEGNITKHLLLYAIPLILGNLFQLTYNVVDSIIIGKYAGDAALAAVGAANPVMTIVILGVSGISIGASVLMSGFYGAGELEQLRKEVSTTIIFGMLFSFAIFLFGILCSKYILIAMRVPEEILDMANSYLRIIFVGFLFTFLYNIMSAVLRSIGDSKTPVIFLAISSILNAILDIIFIYGFGLGVTGAGFATVIAEALSAVLCLLYVYRYVPMLRFRREEFVIDRELLQKTLRHGLITALQQSCQPIGKVMIQGVINVEGISTIAAFNAVNRVDDFACLPEQSISHAMMTCAAQNKGAGNGARIEETMKKGMKLELFYGIMICFVIFILKKPIMQLFSSGETSEMIETGISYLTIMSFFYVLPGFTNGMQGYFRGIGQMKLTLAATLIQISVRTIVVFILVPLIGMNGAAYACAAGWSIMLVYEGFYYFYYHKKLQ